MLEIYINKYPYGITDIEFSIQRTFPCRIHRQGKGFVLHLGERGKNQLSNKELLRNHWHCMKKASESRRSYFDLSSPSAGGRGSPPVGGTCLKRRLSLLDNAPIHV
jgi:hypothetical protein